MAQLKIFTSQPILRDRKHCRSTARVDWAKSGLPMQATGWRDLSLKTMLAQLPAREELPNLVGGQTGTTKQSQSSSEHKAHCRHVSDQMALPMFCLSLLFLTLLAILITTQVYAPRLAELAISSGSTRSLALAAEQLTRYSSILLLLIWPLFWLEHFYNAHAAGRLAQNKFQKKRMLAVCLCPPLRLGATSPAQDHKIWLPKLGWREPGRPLCKELQQRLSMPMLVIALTILPVLLTEKVFASAVAEHAWLRLMLNAATGFIWLAFTAEFIVMVNSSAKKLAYVKANWIDLAIILLPLIAFLRSFSLLAKLGRAYRMRGIIIKTVRALTLLEIVDRVTGCDPSKKLQRLNDQYQEKSEELQELKDEIRFLEAQIASE